MRIAIDIDSTLHHYWDRLSAAAHRRFGVDLPYEEQITWGITRLKPDQLKLCIEETHSAEAILASQPYPGAVETVNAWRDAGHFIHVTSHRAETCHEATSAWLESIGLRYDELYCSYDKISHCVELGIDVLIDDSPANLAKAADRGILPATLRHPWNAAICEERGLICCDDWPGLRRALEPVLAP
jgi:hypothetical protein